MKLEETENLYIKQVRNNQTTASSIKYIQYSDNEFAEKKLRSKHLRKLPKL